jgi:Domain of unknown function (DUF4190)
MTDPQDGVVPPIEPTPAAAAPAAAAPVAAAPVAPPVPPTVDPYAQPVQPGYVAPGYAPGYAPAYQPGYYGAPQPPKGLSIASMVLGIAGVVLGIWYGIGLFPSIAAIITGHMAQKRQPHARGFWIAGLITGYVGLLFSLIGVALLVIVIVVIANGAGAASSFGDFGNS